MPQDRLGEFPCITRARHSRGSRVLEFVDFPPAEVLLVGKSAFRIEQSLEGNAVLGRVLVADDNLNIQRSVAAALKAEDIEVVAVSHGEAAVRKIPEVKPDLILADVFMPVRTGYEVCEFVKSDPNLAHIPVLLLVGALEPLDQKEVGRVKADGFLKKPFESGQLVSTVKGYLSKITRKAPPAPEMIEAAEEFAAAIPFEEAAPAEEFATRPEPLQVPTAEGERPLAFGELLGEASPAEEPAAAGLPESFLAAMPPPEAAPAEEAPLPGFGGFEAQFEAPAPEAPPPTFEAPSMEAAPAFEAPPAAAAAPEELLIEKEAQAWEIQTPISARDPMLAETVTDFMSAPPQVQLPPAEAPWETAHVEAPPAEEAPAEALPAAELGPTEAAPRGPRRGSGLGGSGRAAGHGKTHTTDRRGGGARGGASAGRISPQRKARTAVVTFFTSPAC